MEAIKNTRLCKLHKVTKGFRPVGYNADPVNLVSIQKQQASKIQTSRLHYQAQHTFVAKTWNFKKIITVGFLL